MAKRRIVPLFDLLTRPPAAAPEHDNSTGATNGQSAPNATTSHGNGQSTGQGIGGYGVRGPLPKPVVRLNLGGSAANKPLAQNLPSAPVQASKAHVATPVSALATETNSSHAHHSETPAYSNVAEASAGTTREIPVVRAKDVAASIFSENGDATSAIEAKPSHKFVGSSSTIPAIPAIHGETLEPVPEFDGAKARAATAIAHQAAALSANVDADSQRSSMVSTRTISLVIFAAIVFGVLIYAIAFKLGVSTGKERTEDLIRRDPPVVRELGAGTNQPSGVPNIGSATPTTLNTPTNDKPITNPIDSRPSTVTQQVPPPAPKIQTPAVTAKANAKGIVMPQGLGTQRYEFLPHNPNDFLTARGWEIIDPRTVGLNYMMVATLSTQDAGEAVEFLAANGLEAFGVPILEKPRQGTKDIAPPSGQPSKYRVFVGPGLSSDEVKADRDRPLKARIAELGTFWNKDAKKPTDFREPYLIKHVAE